MRAICLPSPPACAWLTLQHPLHRLQHLDPQPILATKHKGHRVLWRGGPQIEYMQINCYQMCVLPETRNEAVQLRFCKSLSESTSGAYGVPDATQPAHLLSEFDEVRLLRFPDE